MTRDQQVLYLAAALLLSWSESASAAVTVSSGASNVSLLDQTNTVFAFPTISNANELVSISAGSVNYPEGGTLTINVHYVGGTTAQIYSNTFPTFPSTFGFALSSLSNLSFTAGDIDQLIFRTNYAVIPGSGTIPANTTFTFNTLSAAVPEPATWAMMVAGFGAIGISFRRRRRALLAKPS